ncbi:unnamed protein product [Adineta steineri]|uniref:Uncharacterized protein n=1 Tax=Adineta steineri TaxID=433720 RepID=A0A819RSS9_9BILA|nr:unnamed protein product [Adineta steineri]CAF4045457.1 unnamed protein product [Adineta steineri]
MSVSGTIQTNWTGIWHGMVKTYPEGQLGDGWNVTWEIGAYPLVDNSCTTWRIIYTQNGAVQIDKNNHFCRGRGSNDLFIRDSGGGKIAVQQVNDGLVSPFKSQDAFVVVRMQMREDTLEEEVLMTDDNPAIENAIVSLRLQSIHKIKMKRMSISSSE